MRATLGGAEVDLVRSDEVYADVLQRLTSPGARPLFLSTADLDHVHHFGIDSGREGLLDSKRNGTDWLVLPESIPLVWAARRMVGDGWDRFDVSEHLPRLLDTAARARTPVGFLGGDRRLHDSLATVLADRFPSVVVAGMWDPQERELASPEASEELARAIRESGVGLLVVALEKPQQEQWLLRWGPQTGVRVAAGLGPGGLRLLGAAARDRPGWSRLQRARQAPASLYRLVTRSRLEGHEARAGNGRHEPVMPTPAIWHRRLGRTLAATDAAIIGLSSLFAYHLRALLGELGLAQAFEREVAAAIAVLPLWLTIFYLLGCYRPEYLNSGGEALRRFFAGAFAGLLGLGFVSFALNLQLARGYVLLLFSLVLVGGVLARLGVRTYLRDQRGRGRYTQNVLIVGADEEGQEVARAMADGNPAGYRVVGFLDDDLPIGAAVIGELEVLGSPEVCLDAAYDHRVGLVVVSPTGLRAGTLRDVTVALEGSMVDLAVAPSLFQVVTRRMTVESVRNVPILHVGQVRLERGRAAVKRTLDIVASAALLLVLWPVMLTAALVIRLRDGGPVLYRQGRVGREGGHFTMLKFRTMRNGAHEELDHIAHLNEADGHFFKVRDDPRVTRTGRFLRKWSIDEFPQLWNVLRGDMSLVGPRPPLPEEVEKYEPWHLRRLRVRPGVTGVWQVSGRSDVPFDEAVRMDVFYIENWSLGYDLFLIAKTVRAILSRRGAC
jgi:exopolysaccharide biosynthesis polyprenyl glycosylphosphotransferase